MAIILIRETEQTGHVKRKIYVKKLAHMIVEMWQAQNPQDGLADRKPTEAAVQVQRQTSGRIPSS